MRRILILLALLVPGAALPASAAANQPPSTTVTLPVKVIPSIGTYSVGSASLAVSYSDSTASASASSASVGLGPGFVFKVDVCIKAHSLHASFQTTCADKFVDTTAASASTYVSSATASASLARPTGSGHAYFSFELWIGTQQSDGSFKEVASSWPSTGLSAASVAVPAVGASSAPRPASEGVKWGSGATGGLNSGQPDSFCASVQYPAPPPPDPGVSTSVLGDGAPAYYEVGEPTGTYAGQAPRGVMMLIHGGGWAMNGPAMVATLRDESDYWRALGWRTVNVTYRPCNQSLADVQWFYDRAQQLWGTAGIPYCALGQSAGANLALLLAASRPTVACAISEGGPTDASTIKSETTPAGGSSGPKWVYDVLTAAVGEEFTSAWSPALSPIRARVLWAIAAQDPYIPWAQGTELQSKMKAVSSSAYTDLLALASGTTPWVHANVSASAITQLQAHEQQLVQPLVGS